MSRGGFTLVEVLVALAVSAIVALAAHRGAAVAGDLFARAATGREAAMRAVSVRRRIAGWLRSAYVAGPDDPRGFTGVDGTANGGVPDDGIRFVTLTPGPLRHGRALVEIGIDRDPGTAEAGLVADVADVAPEIQRRGRTNRDRTSPRAGSDFARTAAGASGAARRERLVLVPTATGLAVRHRLTVGDEVRWFDGWASNVQLPEAVEVRIIGDSLPPLLARPILVTLSPE